MSIKSLVIAAAAVAVTASAASADSYFSFGNKLDNDTTLNLGTVRAESDGVVEIYRLLGGDNGVLLGSEMVNAGANQDVQIQLNGKPNFDVLAVLKVDGQIVDEQRYFIDRD